MIRSLSACVLVLFCMSMSVAVEDKIDAAKLVGKWEGKGEPKAIIEMTKDNKLIVSVDLGGQKMSMEGTYKVEGNKLSVALKLPGAPEEQKSTMTITKLTDEELVTEEEGKDGKKKVETLKKVK
jgi:uncharacterized protein (TIGR03066 family)